MSLPRAMIHATDSSIGAAIGSSTAKSAQLPGDYLTKFLISARNKVF